MFEIWLGGYRADQHSFPLDKSALSAQIAFMEIVRLSTFDRSAKKAKITESEIAALIDALVFEPESGVVIQGTGGLRKVRFAAGGKGKSGGARAIYVVKQTAGRLFLIAAYRKARQENLTAEQRKAFARLAEALE